RTCRRAQGIGAESIVETGSLRANAIMVRRFQNRVVHQRERIGTLPFSQKEDQVRALRSGRRRRGIASEGRSCRSARHRKGVLQKLTSSKGRLFRFNPHPIFFGHTPPQEIAHNRPPCMVPIAETHWLSLTIYLRDSRISSRCHKVETPLKSRLHCVFSFGRISCG